MRGGLGGFMDAQAAAHFSELPIGLNAKKRKMKKDKCVFVENRVAIFASAWYPVLLALLFGLNLFVSASSS